MSIEWSGWVEMEARLLAYQRKCIEAVHLIATYWAPVIERAAKEDASWVDRTGNARRGLQGFVEDLSETTVAIFLKHGMEYGIYLELEYQGRYAIILPTLESHYQPISDMLHKVFS